MSRVARPSVLLARAIRCRSAGDLFSEQKLLHQCLEFDTGGRLKNRGVELEALRFARFYLALGGCQTGKFEEADNHLRKIGLGARLDDAIWAERQTMKQPDHFFARVLDDCVPAELVAGTRDALGDESEYWEAHHYDDPEQTFYSHAHEPGQNFHIIDQFIEALRPSLKAVNPAVADSVTMAEWWVHRRRPDQWHGHPLHYDTDEQRLRDSQGSRVRHPDVSTVVYMCDDSPRFGPTLVTDQRARCGKADNNDEGVADTGHALLVRPRLGRVLHFDGGYLHGALPGKPWATPAGDASWRLNLMVGWWTQPIHAPQAPEGPPGPLNRVDPSRTWVRSMGCLEGVWEGSAGRTHEMSVSSPVWRDVPGVSSVGAPIFGRYFLTHRGQVDEDIFQ